MKTGKIASAMILALLVCPWLTGQSHQPRAIEELVAAIPFQLEQPYRFDWRADKPSLSQGYVLVLRTDPKYLQPSQLAEPVLYVVDRPGERLNQGRISGHLLVIVPGGIEAGKPAYLDLSSGPIWFGQAALPEQVTRRDALLQRSMAEAAGLPAIGAQQNQRALDEGGGTLRVKDKQMLLAELVHLLRQYAPEEESLIRRYEGYR